MQNIAILIYSLKGGGAERVVSLLSQKLSKKYNLYLIVFDAEKIDYSYAGTLINLNVKSHPNFFIKIINVFRRVYHTRRIKKKYKIEVSISFLGSANLVNILSRKKDKIIVSIRSNLFEARKGAFVRLRNFKTRILYNRADHIIAISKGVAQGLIKEFSLNKNSVDYIYNPLDYKYVEKLSIEPVLEKSLFSEGQFTLLNVGRLTKAKGQWHLIRALSHVKKEIPEVKLLILGRGELEDYLRRLVENLGLCDNVFFGGYKKNPFKYMRSSDLFVFSSLYEGLGNVLLEAMAAGVPVISSDCRFGPREILSPDSEIEHKASEIEYGEYGVLVPICDGIIYDHRQALTNEEKILAQGIIQLYKNKDLREEYIVKGQKRVKDFELDLICSKWEKLLF